MKSRSVAASTYETEELLTAELTSEMNVSGDDDFTKDNVAISYDKNNNDILEGDETHTDTRMGKFLRPKIPAVFNGNHVTLPSVSNNNFVVTIVSPKSVDTTLTSNIKNSKPVSEHCKTTCNCRDTCLGMSDTHGVETAYGPSENTRICGNVDTSTNDKHGTETPSVSSENEIDNDTQCDLVSGHCANACHCSVPELSTDDRHETVSMFEPCCRVCQCSDSEERLISPCLCSGSVKWIHESCLIQWMKSSLKESCELCMKKIKIAKQRKPISKWRLPSQRPTPVLWVLVFITAITLNLASVVKDASRLCKTTPCLVFYAVGCIGVILGTLFLIYWSKRARNFISHWLELNEEWVIITEDELTVQNDPSKPEKEENRVKGIEDHCIIAVDS